MERDINDSRVVGLWRKAGSEGASTGEPAIVFEGPVRRPTMLALALVLSTIEYVHFLVAGFQSPVDALGFLV